MTICSTSAMLPPLLLAAMERALAMLREKAAVAVVLPRAFRNKRRSTDIFHAKPPARVQASSCLPIGLRIGNFRFWLLSGRRKSVARRAGAKDSLQRDVIYPCNRPLHRGLLALSSAPLSRWNPLPGPESAHKGISVFVAEQISRLVKLEQR